MTDEHLTPEPDDQLPAGLEALLGDPDVWADDETSTSDDDLVFAVLAEIAADEGSPTLEAVADAAPEPQSHDERPAAEEQASDDGVVVSLDERRPRQWVAALSGAAAAALLILGVLGIASLGDDEEPPDIEVALEATDLAPAATATLAVTETERGTLLLLDVDDLPPAAPGTYYEAWMRIDAEIGVSAGTFHLRGGDDPIILWTGVSPDDYPLFTVTIQPEAQAESSGVVVLRSRLDG